MKCPSEVELNEYAEGRLEGRRRQEIAVHLDECSGCRAEVEGLDWISSRLQLLAAPEVTQDDRHPSDEELAALAEGRLEGLRQAAVLTHVSSCCECASDFGQLPRRPRRWAWPLALSLPRWQSMAAAAAVLVFALGLFVFSGRGGHQAARDRQAPPAAVVAQKPLEIKAPGGPAAAGTPVRKAAVPAPSAPEKLALATPPSAAGTSAPPAAGAAASARAASDRLTAPRHISRRAGEMRPRGSAPTALGRRAGSGAPRHHTRFNNVQIAQASGHTFGVRGGVRQAAPEVAEAVESLPVSRGRVADGVNSKAADRIAATVAAPKPMAAAPPAPAVPSAARPPVPPAPGTSAGVHLALQARHNSEQRQPVARQASDALKKARLQARRRATRPAAGAAEAHNSLLPAVSETSEGKASAKQHAPERSSRLMGGAAAARQVPAAAQAKGILTLPELLQAGAQSLPGTAAALAGTYPGPGHA